MRAIRLDPPDVAVVDIRMPPTHTDEGAGSTGDPRAASVGGRAHPQPGGGGGARARPLRDRPEGFGYLLKGRVLEIEDFLESVRRVRRGRARSTRR